MRYGKITIWLLTLLFAAMAAVLWTFESRLETMPVALSVTSAGEERTISCWKNEAGEYFFFLPSYAERDSARIQIHSREVRIDGRLAEDEMSCEEFALDTPYSFSFLSREGEVNTVLTFMQSKHLPTLYIDTGSGGKDYIHEQKGNQEAGRMRLYTPDGELSCAGNLDEINGRGNDWLIPKKSYSLELAAEMDLLGMGQAEKWILQANAFDASHARNKLIYDFAAELGLAHSPESRWVDLYLNGEYSGLYLLCERNELHEQRVWPEGEDKYLVSMDIQWRLEQNERPFVTTDSGYAFRVHGSRMDDKTLQQLLQSVENAVSDGDGVDPLTGKHWKELIDLDSWARKYLVEEIFANGDGGAISQYFYGSADEGMMYAGPVWDYDVSMGNFHGEPSSIFAGRPRVRSNVSLSWYYELYRKEDFYERVVEIYRETCLPLLDTFLNVRLEEYVSRIAEASAMNQIRWDSLGTYQISASAEAENIRGFMEERIAFLNQLWLEQELFYRVLIDTNDGHGTLCFAVRPGERIPYLPDYEPSAEILGWYIGNTEAPFDIEKPIWEDMEITLRRIETVPAAEEQTETEGPERRIPMKYVPSVLMLGILGMLFFSDRKRQSRKSDSHEKGTLSEKGCH